MPAAAIVQHWLYDLLPGSPGGHALRDSRRPSYFSSLGSLGGLQTVRRYKSDYMLQLGQRSAKASGRRRVSLPATLIELNGNDLIEVRHVPWWPHQPHRRRWRPVLVWMDVGRVRVASQ